MVPLNRVTEHLFYNKRIILDCDGIETEPRAWKISKVNRISPPGIAMVTMAQDHYDQHKDFIEYDAAGNFVGAWADYYGTTIPKEDPVQPTASLQIVFTGKSPVIKIGGSYKRFSAAFIKQTDAPVPVGQWMFELDGEDAANLVSTTVEDSAIKVKFVGGEEYLGKNLIIKYVVENGGDVSLPVEIAAL